MTKKDYELIAEAIRQSNNMKVDVVDNLVRAFANDNPRFDRTKFYNACGVEEAV